MPIKRTTKDGKPAYKFGTTGTAYPYNPNDEASRKRAYDKAAKQGRAIEASKNKKKPWHFKGMLVY